MSRRVCTTVCESHLCRCGVRVDMLGHHGLFCWYSADHFPRHANLNDVVKRALAAAGIPSWLEPVGLDRGNGRQPDCFTVFPYSLGRSLCWDSCVDTFSASAFMESAISTGSGSAVNLAKIRKRDMYRSLGDRYQFEPVSVASSGIP